MKKFKFKCAVEEIENDPDIIYTANSYGVDLLDVSWEEDGEVKSCYYAETEAEEYIEQGLWVIINE